MRGRRPFCERPLPRAPSRKGREGWRNAGGGRFSKRSASPGPPPEEWLRWDVEERRGEAASLTRSPSPGPPPEERRGGRRWGRGRFSKRSASPPDPLSRRVAGNRLDSSFGGSCPCSAGASPIGWVVVTAADRAAVTYAVWGTNPSARLRAGTSPFRGGFAWRRAQRAPSVEGVVHPASHSIRR